MLILSRNPVRSSVCVIFALTVALGSPNSFAEEDLSIYLEDPYVNDSLEGMRSLIYEDLAPILSIVDSTRVAEAVRIATIERAHGLAERATRIAAAKLKRGLETNQDDSCDYFAISVDQRGIHDSLMKMKNYVDLECSPDLMSKTQSRLLLYADRLDRTSTYCLGQQEK